MSAQTETNTRLSQLVRIFFTVASIIVLVGAGLYFVPDLVVPRWLWQLTPFNANFLGAVYLTELVSASLLIWYNRWAPARIALPMSYVFTGVVTLVTLFYLDRFDFGRWASWFWFVIYTGSFVVAVAAHLVYRRLPVANPVALSQGLRNYLLAQGAVLTVYGLGLLALPSVAGGFWPWRIDDFHGRVYSAFFLSGAVAALMMSRSAARLELRLLGVAQVASGLFPILGLIVVDASQHRVAWSSPGTWLWLAGFAWLLVAGAYLFRKSLAAGQTASLATVPAASPGE
jgi:hypothetical protein